MRELFLLPGAEARSPAVAQWLAALEGPLGELARKAFAELRACGKDVREVMHDGQATACVGDAAFAYVSVHKAHANVGFFHGAALPDPAKLLQGTGKFMRHVKLVLDEPVEAAARKALITAAYRDVRARRKPE